MNFRILICAILVSGFCLPASSQPDPHPSLYRGAGRATKALSELKRPLRRPKRPKPAGLRHPLRPEQRCPFEQYLASYLTATKFKLSVYNGSDSIRRLYRIPYGVPNGMGGRDRDWYSEINPGENMIMDALTYNYYIITDRNENCLAVIQSSHGDISLRLK